MERISIDALGGGWTGESGYAAVSDDGRYVIVSTMALEDPIDAGQRSDLYLVDRQTGDFRMVTLNSAGDAPSRNSLMSFLDSTGETVAYYSQADDLVAGQSQPAASGQIFVTNLTPMTNEMISVAPGTTTSNGSAEFFLGGFTGDARYVGFSTSATDLGPADANGSIDVYVSDRTTGNRELVSVSSSGVAGNADSVGGSLSDDGQLVVFYSLSTNLTAEATNASAQVFLRDTAAGTTTMISQATGGDGGNLHSFNAMISADGSTVAFLSMASDLVAGDTNGGADVFLWDRASGNLTRIPVNDMWIDKFSLSDDGRYIVFSTTTALAANDTNAVPDVYVYDRDTDQIALVSQDAGGIVGNGLSTRASISGDGQTIVFESDATNFVDESADTFNWTDVFATDNPIYAGGGGPTGVTITGDNSPETLAGGPGDDTISGQGGADQISGDAGNDTLNGGDDNDRINGDAGDDTINGDGGSDVANGGAGNDTMNGGSGRDRLYGGGDDDTIDGGTGNDILSGNNGHDTIRGGAGDDTIDGGNGRDDLNGDGGNDTILGGRGNDTATGGNGNDVIDGQGGRDRLNGSTGNDIISGGDGHDRLSGNGDNDILDGGAGNDFLIGGLGEDTLIYNAGNDRVVGFEDNLDTLHIDDALWGGTLLSVSQVLDLATVSGANTVFDFGGGNTLTILGLNDKTALLDDLVIV